MQIKRSIFTTFFLFTTFCALSVSAEATTAGEGRAGAEVYKASCAICHDIGVANAPKVHDDAAWKARNKSVDEFLASAIKGMNAMPPKGTCGNCADAELKAAIEFMISKKK